ncbi:MAG: IS630 family transposase [bacterium]
MTLCGYQLALAIRNQFLKIRKILKNEFISQVLVSLPEGKSFSDTEIWFQDESRVGQQNTITRTWAEKVTRPRIVRQRQFTSTYIFGAACPAEEKAVAMILPECNSYTFQLHLEEISKSVSTGKQAVLIVDQAAWHTSSRLKIPANITLLPLPPYSPELNLMEQVWLFLKQRFLANRVFDNYEDILEACCSAWNSFVKMPNKIKQLCSRKWTQLPVV